MSDLEDLKRRVLATDLSVDNPKIQSMIESDIERLVQDYDLQEKLRKTTTRNIPKYIYDQINFGDRSYTPQQVLKHVKSRDEDGMYILRTIDEKTRENPNKHLSVVGLKNDLVAMVNEENVDKVAISCVCGKHNLTYRDMLRGFVNVNPDVNLIQVPYTFAINDLFYVPKEKPKTSKQPGFLEKAWNYVMFR